MAKKKKPKGGRGCKVVLLASALLLSSCTLQLEDKRIDPNQVAQVLNQHGAVIDAIVTQIGVLQDKGILEKPKAENEAK